MKLRESDRITIKGATIFFLYLTITLFNYVPFKILGVDIANVPVILKCIYIVLLELVLITIVFILYKDYIVKCFKDFKQNKNYYLKKYIKYWFIILFCTAIMNLIISTLNSGNIAGNETAVRDMLGEIPIYTWISGVLIAPFVEELVFRLSLKSIFKSKWVFIIVSGLIFGSFHLIGNTNSLLELLYIFPYSLPGCIFAYILYDSDNIFIPISMHLLHNGILMAAQIFIALVGIGIS